MPKGPFLNKGRIILKGNQREKENCAKLSHPPMALPLPSASALPFLFPCFLLSIYLFPMTLSYPVFKRLFSFFFSFSFSFSSSHSPLTQSL